MADFVRRFVSGNKARFRDDELDLELDLAYITDRIIVMGYPSKGLEGFYRNRREDAKKFLEHRHGNNYWLFNFCPVKENSYPAEVFGGRVSRYPFPDHHAPPLAILPLIAREMRVWLDGSSERVAVLHCKAGKGRSGTMACAYLLTLSEAPNPPTVGRSVAAEETAKRAAQQLMDVMPADVDATVNADIHSDAASQMSEDPIKNELANSVADDSKISTSGEATPAHNPKTNTLEHVLDLHTAGRMKRPSTDTQKKMKPGVSIPSQRRWLYYWSLLLAHQGPPGLWSLNSAEREPAPKVRLTNIKLKMKEISGVKANLIKAASALLDKTGKGKAREGAKGDGQIWLSLARYDDELVESLEWWERHTRSEQGDLGRRREGSEHHAGEELSQIFADERWDKGKMVRTFARLGTVGNDTVRKEETEKDGKMVLYTFRPLTGERWDSLRTGIEKQSNQLNMQGSPIEAEEASIHDATNNLETVDGIVLDANREVRVKLYMGQVFMGWFWFVPTFHMAHPRATAEPSTVLKLTRKELDFPVGVGSHIIDLEVSMEWCAEEADVISPPERMGSAESREGRGDPSSLATTLQAAASGQVSDALEVAQAGED